MNNAINDIKVFISYGLNDSLLASTLKSVLATKNIDSFLFELKPQYDSTLHDKITDAISDAHALIAIITKDNNSMSVHEEIGYAFGKDKTVIIMLEKDAKDGVLSHEREQERFTKERFTDSCKKILEYLQNRINSQISSIDSTTFLQGRNLLDPEADNFCLNPNSKSMNSNTAYGKTTANSVLLFSSCPKKLLDSIPVTSREYFEWSQRFVSIEVSGRRVDFLRGYRQIGQGKVTFYNSSRENYRSYLEIISNGFIEQVHTHPIIRIENFQSIGTKTVLHLNWTAGAFWAFLIFMREHYLNCGYAGKIDIFLSIRDAHKLMLFGFGNRWPEPHTPHWHGGLPHTEQRHIQIKRTTDINAITDEWIEMTAKEVAGELANTYGLESEICFSQDGLLDTNLLSYLR